MKRELGFLTLSNINRSLNNINNNLYCSEPNTLGFILELNRLASLILKFKTQ